MKRLRVLLAILAMLTLSLMITGCGSSGGGSGSGSNDNTVSLTILETSDVHDHAGGYGSAASYSPMTTGNDAVLGGYARLATYISDVKNQKGANNVLLCDSGDFTMGTVYSMTLAETPLSFMFFSIMGYDAVTLGNHELDLGPNALYSFITNAQGNTTYPFSTPIIASNMNTNGHPINGKIVPSMIIEKAGIKIGLLGQMGPNADSDAAYKTPLTLDHTYAALQAQVDDLRNNQHVQLVVLLSHEGFTNSGDYAKGNDIDGTHPDKANDADIANYVTGIDVILSGHLHINQTALKTSLNPNNTILVEPGAYGTNIARLDLKVDKTTGKITSYTSTNPNIDDSIVGDSWMDYIVATQTNSALNIALGPAFTALGLTGVTSILDTVAINDAPINDDLITSFTVGQTVGESVLGNLTADSYRNMINLIWSSHGGGSAGNAAMTWATGDANRVQIAFVPGGVIRDPLAVEAGTISFADLYNVVPLGADPDPAVDPALGYPLLTTYITAHDVYTVVGLSLLAGAYLGNGDYYINFAGIYVHVFSWPSSFYVYLCPDDSSGPNAGINGNFRTSASLTGTWIDPTDTTTKYKIAVDFYTYIMMKTIAGAPYFITINAYATSSPSDTTPIDASGNRVWTSLPPNKNRTLRGWQAMEEWPWVVGAHATSNLSNAGYYKTYPYPRVQ